MADTLPATLFDNKHVYYCVVRAMSVLELNAKALEFIATHPLPNNTDARKAKGIACEQIGWWLFGQEKYEEAIAFLEKHSWYDIGPNGRTNMNALYRTLLGQLDDDTKLKAFDAKMPVAK